MIMIMMITIVLIMIMLIMIMMMTIVLINDHDDDDYDDVMVTLLRFALLFLIFSRELETDFGGNMFSRLLAYPGSDNKPLPLLLSLLPKLPTSLTWLRQLTVETWRS